ncbi:TetR/AcrR family transcriptional regulator [Pseudooceanicola sp. C21-150M6]|uniref:TetR/AcrR family transcriptional regulator n=1 Tax=Pseudooceanicola sp. C21-150M6 TaxID=3434355 RepID=UPI003D7F400B
MTDLDPENTATADRARKPGTADVRAEILARAQKVFLEQGYEAASMREIVKASGFSKPTLYSHFGSKERLFEAIITSVCDRISLPDVAVPRDMSAREVLESLVLAYRRTVLNPDFIELYRLVIAEAKRFPELGAIFYKSGPQASRWQLAEILQSLLDRGLLAGLGDTQIAAEQFEALVLEPIKLRAFLLPEETVSETQFRTHAQAAIELFLRALDPHRT